MIVTDESEVEETISLARSVLTEGKMVLIKSVSKFGVHAQVVGQIRKKVTLPKTNPDPKPSVTYFHHFLTPKSTLCEIGEYRDDFHRENAHHFIVL